MAKDPQVQQANQQDSNLRKRDGYIEVSEQIFSERFSRDAKKNKLEELLASTPIITISVFPEEVAALTDTKTLISKISELKVTTGSGFGEVPSPRMQPTVNGIIYSAFGNRSSRVNGSYVSINGLVVLKRGMVAPNDDLEDEAKVFLPLICDTLLLAILAAQKLYQTFEFDKASLVQVRINNALGRQIQGSYDFMFDDGPCLGDLDTYSWEFNIDKLSKLTSIEIATLLEEKVEQVNYDLGVPGLTPENHLTINKVRPKP